jgi:hypothetical protein
MRDAVPIAGSGMGGSGITGTLSACTTGGFFTLLRLGELTAFFAFDFFCTGLALLLLPLVIGPSFLFFLEFCSRQKDETQAISALLRRTSIAPPIFFLLTLRVKVTQDVSVSLVTLFFVRSAENFSCLLDLAAKFAPKHRPKLASGEAGDRTLGPRVGGL